MPRTKWATNLVNKKKSKDFLSEETFTRDKKKWSWKYKWPDRLAKKLKLTEKQKIFCDRYLDNWKNAGDAFKVARMVTEGLTYKQATMMADDFWPPTKFDRANWYITKNRDNVKEYLETKMLTTAEECLDLQMDLIRDEKIPAAVRTTNIIDRLNRIWIWKHKEEDTSITGVWEVTITIKHKKLEPIEIVDWEVLDTKEDNGTISTELWADWEARWSVGEADW